jgi:glycerol-3-phosphate dehydrogenase
MLQKQTKSHNFEQNDFDVAIVGAGINGAVAAAAAQAAGLRVLIIDRGDFANFTSQESSNLVWGGIKYLQTYEFALVAKLCQARNRLIRAYPNQIQEIGFLASLGPNAPFGRLLGIFGTWFYWFIGTAGTTIPASYSAKRAKSMEPALKSGLKAVEYFDAYLPDNDSRFVYGFIKRAKKLGATALNYTELVGASHESGRWNLELSSAEGKRTVSASAVINAAGPFAQDVSQLLESPTRARLVFSKGVHFTINRRLTSQNRVLALWDEQKRLFYVLPMGDRSIIGTTDTRVDDPRTEPNDQDIDFVLKQVNDQLGLEQPITRQEIIASRSGVRPLVIDGKQSQNQDWHQLSRKHVIEANPAKASITILGGKLTDCLNVGAEVIAELRGLGLQAKLPRKWFGEGSQARRTELDQILERQGVDAVVRTRLVEGMWRRHGERAFEFATDEPVEVFEGLGISFGELRYVAKTEDVVTREDLLRRRLPIAMSRSAAEIAENSKLQSALVDMGL